MPKVSAVILSASPARAARSIAGVKVVGHISRFNDAEGLLAARLEAIKSVDTDFFFFLDDDDELPRGYRGVLDRCMAAGTPLAYTDEVITAADGSEFTRRGRAYSEMAFIKDCTLVHHLTVCRTDAALRASAVIPRGKYAVENLLFFEVAKAGATYIPEVGYIWHRRETGLNRHPSILIGLVQSTCWASRNRSVRHG